MSIRAILILAVAALAITGCGRRGELEPPGSTAADSVPGPEAILSPASPGATEPPEQAPAAAPDKRFFLDPLI